MQDLNDMGYFAEVAQRGSFAAAARALGLPKSRLSRRIAHLEAQLGVRLLQRTTRKLSLTTVGEMYLRHCVAICDEAQAAADAVAQASSEPRGVVRLSCPVTLAQSVVGAALPEFLAQHPLVQIQMEVSNRVVDVIEEGIDIALRVRTTLSASGSLVVKHLGLSQTLLVASPQQLRRQGAPRGPEELAAMDTVAMSPTEGRYVLKLLGPQGKEFLALHHPRYVAGDLLAVKLAVLAGIGVGMLPDYMCREELADGRLAVALPGWSLEPGIVHAVFPSRRGLVPAVRLLLDFLGVRMAQDCDQDRGGPAMRDPARRGSGDKRGPAKPGPA
ncbi:LysR family transcriptional regulator [Candidimonas nitroreducens]|uniref:LysR family transcriptional regulator n=1 Tax=Candidimonas nitroreducens TaxID=683354 RepID=A0A225M804_9BURK|nr:LysR family transcriptional regulator [Candidimonas nitroreducens]OWT57457.1 LysR family transcriptional regulator [Candidimonas nitroreducens]